MHRRPHIKITDKEALWTLLDANYDKYFDGSKFWCEMHAIDKEIKPGAIRCEEFKDSHQKILDGMGESKDFFNPGHKTLVIRVEKKETAMAAARMLRKIFDGCGIKFVPEAQTINGVTHYHIRSDIDKPMWEKLCVFTMYRFEREVTDKDQKKQLTAECQKVLDGYTAACNHPRWVSTEGIPAFCGIMGLHGILRPEGPYKIDPKRKLRELNEAHPCGTPLLFRDVVLFVNVKKHGAIEYQECQPYDVTFNPSLQALNLAEDGERYHEQLGASLGGWPFKHGMVLSRRVREAVGLSLGLYGLKHFGEDIVGLAGPIAAAAATTAFLAIGYIDHKWKILDNLEELQIESKKRHVPVAQILQEKVAQAKEHTVDPALCAAYTREGGPDHSYALASSAAIEKEAFSPESMTQLRELISEHCHKINETRLHTKALHKITTTLHGRF